MDQTSFFQGNLLDHKPAADRQEGDRSTKMQLTTILALAAPLRTLKVSVACAQARQERQAPPSWHSCVPQPNCPTS